MTDEQVELELAHWELDRKLKSGTGASEEYEDPDYDQYDKETDELDEKSSYEYEPDGRVKPHVTGEEEEWEDVETDDFDPEYDG